MVWSVVIGILFFVYVLCVKVKKIIIVLLLLICLSWLGIIYFWWFRDSWLGLYDILM